MRAAFVVAALLVASCTDGFGQSVESSAAQRPDPGVEAMKRAEYTRDLTEDVKAAFRAPDAFLILVTDLDGNRYEFVPLGEFREEVLTGPAYPRPVRGIKAILSFTSIAFDQADNVCFDMYDTGNGAIARSTWVRSCKRPFTVAGLDSQSDEEVEAILARETLTTSIRNSIGVDTAVVADVFEKTGGVRRFLGVPPGFRHARPIRPSETSNAPFVPSTASRLTDFRIYTALVYEGSTCTEVPTGDGRRCRYCYVPPLVKHCW